MNVRVILGETSEQDLVQLENGARYYWNTFIKFAELSVKAVRSAFDTNTITRDATVAYRWLNACGIHSRKEFEDFEQHLPQLKMPADSSNTRRCVVCGSQIWGKESLLTGVGSGCRRENHASKAVRQLKRTVTLAASARTLAQGT